MDISVEATSGFPSQTVSYVEGIPESDTQPTPLVPNRVPADLMFIKKKSADQGVSI